MKKVAEELGYTNHKSAANRLSALKKSHGKTKPTSTATTPRPQRVTKSTPKSTPKKRGPKPGKRGTASTRNSKAKSPDEDHEADANGDDAGDAGDADADE